MASVTYEAVTLVYPNAKAPTVNNFDLEVADGEFHNPAHAGRPGGRDRRPHPDR